MPKATWQKRNFDCGNCGENPIDVLTSESGDWVGEDDEVVCPNCSESGRMCIDIDCGSWVSWRFEEE